MRVATIICASFIMVLLVASSLAFAQDSQRTIHVTVALCDNKNQGIVPVPESLGNGEDPKNNLYWGAMYGVKTFFGGSDDWNMILCIKEPEGAILERCVFKHRTANVYLVADAYKGIEIRKTVTDFLEYASGRKEKTVPVQSNGNSISLKVGGAANLVAYVGHDGLMDFQLETYPIKGDDAERDAIILACISKSFFLEPLRSAGANPVLWTTGLMAPEAYTLKSAIDGWILNESGEDIRLRAARAYDKYQDCGLNAARNLLVTGW